VLWTQGQEFQCCFYKFGVTGIKLQEMFFFLLSGTWVLWVV
jgi:hypothetical protein